MSYKYKMYVIYNEETNEEYMTGFNEFTAMNNFITAKAKYGDKVKIKWVEVE